MDPRIQGLESTTFLGKRLTRNQIALMQETVELLPNDSRRELSRTICENFGWFTSTGSYREQFCLRVLEKLEAFGVLELPPVRPTASRRGPAEWTEASDPDASIAGPLPELQPLLLEPVAGTEAMAEWTELVDRYHPRGYKSPIGRHFGYLIRDRGGRRLGCLMFEASGDLACRDAWIGWTAKQRDARLSLVLRNSRFLIFPWVSVDNLASHALSQAARRIAGDWQQRWNERPALAETFIDREEQEGSCYKAAGWQRIGETSSSRPKDVYVLELEADSRAVLTQGRKNTANQKRRNPEAASPQIRFWSQTAAVAASVADRHDREWRARRRLIGTFLVIIFVFRLAMGGGRSYAAALEEIWESMSACGAPLPQEHPVSTAAICKARAKVDAAVFKTMHREILATAPAPTVLNGRRVFAVDGAKTNLPEKLKKAGYKTPGPHAHYPQGLVSCLCQLHSRIPFDFDLHAHLNERRAAVEHMRQLSRGDVIVYDRGYHSYEFQRHHTQRGLDAVFRLKRNGGKAIKAFFDDQANECEITIRPGKKVKKKLQQAEPDAEFPPLHLRLVKYRAGKTVFVLGTTLAAKDGFTADALAEIYHARWQTEEHFKTAKWFMNLEEFSAKSENGVKQELYANFSLIAMTRLMTNDIDAELNEEPDTKGRRRINFKHAIENVARNFEALIIRQSAAVDETIARLAANIAKHHQRERPERSYRRRSRKPVRKWARKSSKAN